MTIISASSETTSYNFQFSSNGQTVIVQENVFVVSDTATSVADSIYSGAKIFNYGSVISAPSSTFGGIATSADGTYIVNEESGKVSAAYAVYFVGGATHGTIVNKGDVDGSIDGIISSETGTFVTNTGVITGDTDGISFSGSSQSIQNLGQISGGSDGIALNITSGAERVSNSGVVHGLDHSVNVIAGTIMLKNLGTLDGDVSLSDGADRVTNTGAIVGDVNLGNGDNIFNGRGGTVSGAITGGTGADAIYAGNDGETLGGGAGHDKLHGGAGADHFLFASTLAADRDTVLAFDAAHDTLVLDDAAFTHLAVGATPVFAVAAAATSATDDLFYNAATGGLYYDPDGSGSHAASLFATLAPGLNLTAANFEVV